MNQLLLNRVVIAVHPDSSRIQEDAPAIFARALAGQDYGNSPIALVLPHTQYMAHLMWAAKQCISDVRVTGMQWPVPRCIDEVFWAELVAKTEMNPKKDVLMVLLDERRAHVLVEFLAEYRQIPKVHLEPRQILRLKLRPKKTPGYELLDKPIESATEKPAAE